MCEAEPLLRTCPSVFLCTVISIGQSLQACAAQPRRRSQPVKCNDDCYHGLVRHVRRETRKLDCAQFDAIQDTSLAIGRCTLSAHSYVMQVMQTPLSASLDTTCRHLLQSQTTQVLHDGEVCDARDFH